MGHPVAVPLEVAAEDVVVQVVQHVLVGVAHVPAVAGLQPDLATGRSAIQTPLIMVH